MQKFALSALAIIITTTGAMAQDQNSKISWFVGGNAAISNTLWSSALQDSIHPVELEKNNFGLGAEAGVRIGDYNKVSNLGFTFNYDYLFNAGADIPSPYNSVFSEINSGFSAISLSVDTYIRVSTDGGKRSDLFLGLGYARANERFSVDTTSYAQLNGFYSTSVSDNGGATVFKIGVNSELTEHLDWNVGLRFLVPTNHRSDMELIAIGYTGLRIKF